MNKFKIKQDDLDLDYESLKESPYFYNFANGVDLEENEINKYIYEIILKFKEDKNMEYYYVASGNTILFGILENEGDINTPDWYINIFICKKYEEINLPLKNIF